MLSVKSHTPAIASSTHLPLVREMPTSGLSDQRLVPRLISLVGSYWPSGGATVRLTPTIVRCRYDANSLRRHRRRPVEVHRHTESRIAQSEPVDLCRFTQIQAFDVTGDHGHHHTRVGRSSSQVERPRERECRRVDPGAGFVDRRRRIERHIAEVEAVDDGEDVQPFGERPVRAGFELLRRCRHWHQEERERCGRAGLELSQEVESLCLGRKRE